MRKILSNREKIILYITIFIIILSAVFNFLLAPILNKIDILDKEISLSLAKLRKYSRLLEQKEAIQAKYDKFALHLKGLGSQTDASVNLLSVLEAIADASAMRIIDIRPQAGLRRDSASHTQISAELKIEGTIESCLKFIYQVENSPLILKIKRFQLNAKPNTQFLEGNFFIAQALL